MGETIGFIGLGNLGLPMATNLLKCGYGLRVYNRTRGKGEALAARGASIADKPAEVATAGGVVISVVWDDAALASIVDSDGFLERLGEGGIHISSSTVSPEAARRLAELHQRHGVAYVDAPIFGRPEAAVARQLLVPIAGPFHAKQRARPILDAAGAKQVFDFGERVGAAVLVKLVGNFLIGSAGRSLAEALTVARAGGVDPQAVVEMLTTTLFAAPIYQSYGKHLAAGGAPFRGGIPEKDIGLLASTAQRIGVPAPMVGHLLELLKA